MKKHTIIVVFLLFYGLAKSQIVDIDSLPLLTKEAFDSIFRLSSTPIKLSNNICCCFLCQTKSIAQALNNYQICLDTILTDTTINKGFYFLRAKHNKKYKFKQIDRNKLCINRYSFQVEDYCGSPVNSSQQSVPTNTADHVAKPRFELFFSNYQNNTIECIIANYHKVFDHNLWHYTRFGKIMKIRFCFQNNKISNITVELRFAG